MVTTLQDNLRVQAEQSVHDALIRVVVGDLERIASLWRAALTDADAAARDTLLKALVLAYFRQ
jgi:hypothetical protein